MTVFMVKKYLVRKLGLSNEAQVISLSLSLSYLIITEIYIYIKLKLSMHESDFVVLLR